MRLQILFPVATSCVGRQAWRGWRRWGRCSGALRTSQVRWPWPPPVKAGRKEALRPWRRSTCSLHRRRHELPADSGDGLLNGAQQSGEEPTIERVSFMDFPVIGSQYTYDSTSFCPDSASTATSIASGRKTASGVINVSPDASERFETIAEKLKRQLGYKVGVLTSVNLNHATPAALCSSAVAQELLRDRPGAYCERVRLLRRWRPAQPHGRQR